MNLIIGIDPGVTGAIAVYDYKNQKLIDVHDMPNYTVSVKGNKRKRVELKSLNKIIKQYAADTFFGVIEQVGAGPKDGRVSAFSFGFSTGVLHMALTAHELPVFTIRPQIWKPAFNLGADKKLSNDRARVIFPEQNSKFLRNSDHGRAEAALIAKYGVKFLAVLQQEMFQ